ncbi:MAG TPA: glycosyltransferase family 39 protein [Candidatus Saccharimonadales bacterium]|nr:glycosyltransferase family 39 protein [Candidatus Saccharimonadales bacterium]
MVTILILVSSFFRLWQIRNYQVFLGDEGRDMIVMRTMILEKRPTFLGPTASVGGFYLGPIYYWMAAPFLLISNYDPVGPSIMVAIIGIATVLLLYKFLKETLGFWSAIQTAFLYATAPLIVRYSRSSWNPNPLPFFALLMIYAIYRGIKNDKLLNFLFAGACFGIAIQLHYLAIMLIPVTALIVFVNTSFKKWPLIITLMFAGSLITFSPFLLFEIKHNFPNFKTIYEFVTRPTTHGFQTIHLVWKISNFGNILLEDISHLVATIWTKAVFWILSAGTLAAAATNWRNKDKKLIFTTGAIYFIAGLMFLRYYSGQIFDYYFGYMFPAPFIATAIIYYLLWQKKVLRIIPIFLTCAMLFVFTKNGFYTNPPNKLINQTEQVADFVIEKSNNQPYNFGLLTDHNSDHAYRYFLDIKGHKPTELETLVTDQLLVVCETKICAPLGYPSWEVAGFGPAEIDQQWELTEIGITVFKLTHWAGAPNPAGKPAIKGK